MSDHLPPDLLSEILTRLPIINIQRCTSVCKSWYSLITSSNFITTHLNRNICSNSNQIMIRHATGKSINFMENYSVYHDIDKSFEFRQLFNFPLSRGNSCVHILGICNGLICLSEDMFSYYHVLILWNPSIRKYVYVPPPNVPYCRDDHFHHALGFGFTHSTNECKIVRVLYFNNNSTWVELYELSTGSWRNINAGLSHGIDMQEPQAFLKGVVHWMGFDPNKPQSSSRPFIVSFDVESEVFGFIRVPNDVHDTRTNSLRVAKFEDSISLIRFVRAHDVGYCCIWVMKEYGVEESWVKVFTIDLRQMNLRRPFGFRGNGQFLMVKKRRRLVSYDPESEQIEFLNVDGSPSSFYADTFIESLFLIDGSNGAFKRNANICDAVNGGGVSTSSKEEDKFIEKLETKY